MADIGIYLNWAYNKEHVPEIERFNSTIKKRIWYAQPAMPLKRISKWMISRIFASTIFVLMISSVKTWRRTAQQKIA